MSSQTLCKIGPSSWTSIYWWSRHLDHQVIMMDADNWWPLHPIICPNRFFMLFQMVIKVVGISLSTEEFFMFPINSFTLRTNKNIVIMIDVYTGAEGRIYTMSQFSDVLYRLNRNWCVFPIIPTKTLATCRLNSVSPFVCVIDPLRLSILMKLP